MAIFRDYASYYDLINRGKDYARECDYLLSALGIGSTGGRGILELGCGTGGHALRFAGQGLPVLGIDISTEMLEVAEGRAKEVSVVGADIQFQAGDAKSFRAGRSFDAVLSLFHVVSYQTTNDELASTFETARCHLDVGGRFMFDFWYGPAVLTDRPRHVERTAENEEFEVVRKTTPTMRVNDNCVDVHFDISVRRKASGELTSFSEDHHMRYLFLPEVSDLLGRAALRPVQFKSWLSTEAPSDKSWYACCVAEAV